MREFQEKHEIEIETIIAMTEAKLIIDEPIFTVECEHQEARTEAEISRTRVVLISQRQRRVLRANNVAVSVSKIMHLRNARIVLNAGIQTFPYKIALIQMGTS